MIATPDHIEVACRDTVKKYIYVLKRFVKEICHENYEPDG
jgi:hypothetical protein